MSDLIIKNNIRALRKKAGLTQEQLAEKIGISQVHLGRLENNARSMDLEQVENIAKALGVQPLDILPQAWQPEEVTPEEREILRMIRKSATPQGADNNHIPSQESVEKLPPQPAKLPDKNQERD